MCCEELHLLSVDDCVDVCVDELSSSSPHQVGCPYNGVDFFTVDKAVT